MQTKNLNKQKEDFEKSIKDLIEKGYAEFNINLTKEDFIRCMEPMKQITAKNHGLTYCTDPEAEEHDRGLFYRSKNQGKDDKWCFHHYENIENEFHKKFGEGVWNNDLLILLNNSKKVHREFQKKSSEIVKAIDSLMPEFGLYDLYINPMSQAFQVARFVAYDEAKERFTVAGRHFDQSFITLQGYQSHSGLYLIDQQGKKIKLEYHEGKVWVFFGRKAPLLTGGKLTASEHGVNVFEKGIQRDAVPFFGHTYRPEIL